LHSTYQYLMYTGILLLELPPPCPFSFVYFSNRVSWSVWPMILLIYTSHLVGMVGTHHHV
jgi:hypothetical protein